MVKRKGTRAEAAAVDELLRNLRAARAKGDYKELANIHNQLGNQHRLLGNYSEALEHHHEEANICIKHLRSDKLGLGIAYRNIGEVLTETKDEVQAVDYILKYLNLARAAGNFVEIQRAHITLGRAYLNMAEKDDLDNENSKTSVIPSEALLKADTNFKAAYRLLHEEQLIDQLKDDRQLMLMKCNNCQNLGLTLDLRGKTSDAVQWLLKAIDIGSKYSFNEYLAPCYAVLCNIHLKTGKFKEALEAAKNASKTAKSLGNHVLEVESKLLEAKSLFRMDEVETGKKILKILRVKIKKKQELREYLEELDALLIAAVRICRTLDAVFVTAKNDKAKLLTLNEILADNNVTLMNYHVAIEHYKKCCKLAEDCQGTSKRLAKLYFSIGETYMDLQDYENAYEYYIKEIALNRGNAVEEFKTQTNITVVLEKMNKPHEEVIQAHEAAIAFGKLSRKYSNIVTALKNYGEYLKNIDRREESNKQFEEAKEINEQDYLQDSEEMDSEDLLNGESDIDLDHLSDEEDSDDEIDDGKKGKKKLNVKRNEAGETQLHTAAKKGDIKSVRRLIRQGHPVNERDNAGWSPLHEACNFGHAEVVEELLKHGAKVNDTGGQGGLAERITPLHDAACNCHCDVMKVLIKYNADVLAKDAEGRYPIDSLVGWRHSEEGRNSSEQELLPYREVKELLIQRMANAGRPYRKSDEVKAIKRISNRSRSPKLSLLVAKPQDYECPIPVKIATDDFDPDQEGDGTKLYQNAMKQLRRKNQSSSKSKERPRAMSPGPRGALIPEDLDVHGDWLLPDDTIKSAGVVHQQKSKRKRDDNGGVEHRNTRRKMRESRESRRVSGSSMLDEDTHNDSNNELENSDVLMDIDSDRASSPNNSSSNSEVNRAAFSDSNSDNPNYLCDNNFNVSPVDVEDDFLPSQRPGNFAIEFGKTVDVEILSDDGEDATFAKGRRGSPLRQRARTTSGGGRVKSRRALEDSSDDEITNEASNYSRSIKMSDFATSLKQHVTTSHTSKTRKNEVKTVQTRLPYSIANKQKPFRNSRDHNRDKSSSPEIGTRAFRRTSSSSHLPQHSEKFGVALRLKVQINETLLLVPVEENNINKNIDWLATECAIRYAKQHGVRPVLTLQTKDGATLSGTDIIHQVLDASERELVGLIVRFDLRPLVERYDLNCTEAGRETDPEVTSGLNICQSSNVLELTDICLRGNAGIPVITALQWQSSLRTLALSGCSLFDNGICELCKVLPTLSGLMELDLSNNGVTKNGLSNLADTIKKSGSVSVPCASSSGLNSLILSHNPLGNSSGCSIASLIKDLPALRKLEIAGCGLTEKVFVWNKTELTEALNKSRLEEIDISYNNLKDGGLEKFLKHLPARKIRNLNCSASTFSSNNPDDSTARAISSFLSQNEDCCNLRTLQLNDCHLNDKLMDELLLNFNRLVRLETLELRCNNALTAMSLTNIIHRSVDLELPFSSLDMSSIPGLWDTPRVTPEIFLNAVDKKMTSNSKLKYLRLPCNLTEEKTELGDDQSDLSNLESRTVQLLEDYYPNSTFKYEKHGASITYRFIE